MGLRNRYRNSNWYNYTTYNYYPLKIYRLMNIYKKVYERLYIKLLEYEHFIDIGKSYLIDPTSYNKVLMCHDNVTNTIKRLRSALVVQYKKGNKKIREIDPIEFMRMVDASDKNPITSWE